MHRYAPEVNQRLGLMRCLGVRVDAWCAAYLGSSEGLVQEAAVEEQERRVALEHAEHVAWEGVVRCAEAACRAATGVDETRAAEHLLRGMIAAQETLAVDHVLSRSAVALAEATRREGVGREQRAWRAAIQRQYAVGNAVLDLVDTEMVTRLRVLKAALEYKHNAFKALKAAGSKGQNEARVRELLAAPVPRDASGMPVEAPQADASSPPPADACGDPGEPFDDSEAAGAPRLHAAAAEALASDEAAIRIPLAHEERGARRALLRDAVAQLEACSARWFAASHAAAAQ